MNESSLYILYETYILLKNHVVMYAHTFCHHGVSPDPHLKVYQCLLL